MCDTSLELFFLINPHKRVCFIDFRERGSGVGEREREKHHCEKETLIGLPPVHALTEDGTHNVGMCSDRGSNPLSFGARDDAQPTEPLGQG